MKSLCCALICVVLCVAVGSAQAAGIADVVDYAGIGIVQPFQSGEDTIVGLAVSGKLLPVAAPEALTLTTVPQYVVANLHLDLVLHDENGRIPMSLEFDGVRLTPALSLPLLTAGNEQASVRAGLARASGSGWGVYAMFGASF